VSQSPKMTPRRYRPKSLSDGLFFGNLVGSRLAQNRCNHLPTFARNSAESRLSYITKPAPVRRAEVRKMPWRLRALTNNAGTLTGNNSVSPGVFGLVQRQVDTVHEGVAIFSCGKFGHTEARRNAISNRLYPQRGDGGSYPLCGC
jgi:hypothetical protein